MSAIYSNTSDYSKISKKFQGFSFQVLKLSFRFSIAKMKLNDASYLKVLPSREMVYPLGTNLRTQEVKKSNPEPAPRDGGYRPTGPMPDGWGHHLSFALMGLVPNEYNGLLQ